MDHYHQGHHSVALRADDCLRDRVNEGEITEAQAKMLRRYALGEECPYCHTRKGIEDGGPSGLDTTYLCPNCADVDEGGSQWTAEQGIYDYDGTL